MAHKRGLNLWHTKDLLAPTPADCQPLFETSHEGGGNREGQKSGIKNTPPELRGKGHKIKRAEKRSETLAGEDFLLKRFYGGV